jgi:AmiR/NasT family two-component response regulator
MLMERFNLNDDAAFAVLKRTSSHLDVTLRAVAAQLVETRQLPPELTKAQDKPRTAR